MELENLRILGRATQGVRLISLKGKDTIAAVSVIKDGKQQRLDDLEAEAALEEAGEGFSEEGFSEEGEDTENDEEESNENGDEEVTE
jgi:DNA gyrase subunit A